MLHRNLVSLAAGLVVWLTCGLSLLASPPANALYPLEVGTKWTYQAGPYELEEEVMQIDVVDGEHCARVETRINGKAVAFEHLAHRPDGIYRVSVAGDRVVPPLCFLKFPIKPQTAWSVHSAVGEEKISGQFTTAITRIKVPAGEYQAIMVHGTNFESEAGPLELKYYFAPGVGKVKQVISAKGKSAELELKKFTPAP